MPDVALPGHRFAYGQDGSLISSDTRISGITGTGTWTFRDAAFSALLNDEDGDVALSHAGSGGQGQNVSLWFPEARDLLGVFAHGAWGANDDNYLFVSTNTTNGQDGTWTQVLSSLNDVGTNGVGFASRFPLDFRTKITAVPNALGILGVRWRIYQDTATNTTKDFRCWHLYGKKSAATSGLSIWDPLLDQEASFGVLDFGDTRQGSSYVRQFRVKNQHLTQTASTISITTASASLTMAADLAIGANAYGASVSISSLAPAQVSDVISVRRIVPSAETLRPQALRLSVVASSWA